MKCPNCKQILHHTKYAGANVRECPLCSGLLVTSFRASTIQSKVNKDIDQLKEEVEQNLDQDTEVVIRCPECRDKMTKRQIKALTINIDECQRCQIKWFDAGELAMLQLEFETRSQTIELNQMRERLNNMTDSQRQEYENRIAELRDIGSPFGEAFRSATFELAARHSWWSIM